ncbi:MAG: hypothetical protein WDN26_14120 [Chitinophagaceae bacterium]
MKTTCSLILLSSLLLLSLRGKAQLIVPATSNYSVTINVQPVSIITTYSNCPFGFNYNVEMHYSISINGPDAPPAMYNLQGTLDCGANTHFFQLPLSGGVGTVVSQSTQWSADCNTNTLATLTCNTIHITISGPQINHQVLTYTINNALPVSMVDFSAIPFADNTVKLGWTTLSEDNNDYFTIERSGDANNWMAIGTVKGAGNSSGRIDYSYTDKRPLEGTSYYRIRQTDIDGRSTVSLTRPVERELNKNRISMYPIPNTGNIVTIKGLNDATKWELILAAQDGRTVYTSKLSSVVVPLPPLTAGFYIIRLINKSSGESISLRYVKG